VKLRIGDIVMFKRPQNGGLWWCSGDKVMLVTCVSGIRNFIRIDFGSVLWNSNHFERL
jgi:hypothetical protein